MSIIPCKLLQTDNQINRNEMTYVKRQINSIDLTLTYVTFMYSSAMLPVIDNYKYFLYYSIFQIHMHKKIDVDCVKTIVGKYHSKIFVVLTPFIRI